MFHRDKKHYVTAEIRKIPVAYLLNLEMTALDEVKKRIYIMKLIVRLQGSFIKL